MSQCGAKWSRRNTQNEHKCVCLTVAQSRSVRVAGSRGTTPPATGHQRPLFPISLSIHGIKAHLNFRFKEIITFQFHFCLQLQ